MTARKTIMVASNTAWSLYVFRKNLIKALLAAGYEVVALCPADEKDGAKHSTALRQMGCIVRPIHLKPDSFSPWSNMRTFLGYIYLIGRTRPAALLAFTIKPNIFASLAARFWRVPVVNNITGRGKQLLAAGAKRNFFLRLYRLALGGVSHVFFQNKEDMALFVKHKAVSAPHCTVLGGSGVDIEAIKYTPPIERADGQTHFIMISRILATKGVAEFLAAAQRLKEMKRPAQFTLVCAPHFSDKPCEIDVQPYIDDGTITCLPAQDDVLVHLQQADCLVLPTYGGEGTPRTIIEAGAVGRSVIASDVAGCRDIIRHRVNGLLCVRQSVKDLVEKMNTFIDMPIEEKIKYGQAARAIVEKDYAEALIIKKYMNVLSGICE